MRFRITLLITSLFLCLFSYGQIIEEDFENDFPTGWTSLPIGDDSWEIIKGNMFISANSPDHFIAIYNYGSSRNEDLLITPQVTVKQGMELSFYARSFRMGQKEDFNVKVSKEGIVVADFKINLIEIKSASLKWTEYKYTLTDHPEISNGDKICIAIQSVGLKKGLFIDDFKISAQLNDEANIVSFNIPNGPGDKEKKVEIDPINNTVKGYVYSETNITALKPKMELTAGAVFVTDTSVAYDFSNPVIYETEAESGKKESWSVSLSVYLREIAEIEKVEVPDQLEGRCIGNTFYKYVNKGTDLSNIEPVFTLTKGASISPKGVQDFSNGKVKYTVTAEDGITKKEYYLEIRIKEALESFFEGFEAGEAIPFGWKAVNKDGDDKEWTVIKNAKYQGDFGIKKNTVRIENNNDWLITPQVIVKEDTYFSFWARSASSKYLEDFNVLASNSGDNIEDFKIVLEKVEEADPNYDFTRYKYRLKDIEGINVGDKIFLALQIVTNDGMELHVDNFYVGPPVPEIEISKNHLFQVIEEGTEKISAGFTIKNILDSELKVSRITDLSGSVYSTTFNKADVSLKPGETYNFTFTFAPSDSKKYEQDFVIESNGGNAKVNLKGFAYKKGAYHESFEDRQSYKFWKTIDNDGDNNNWFPQRDYENLLEWANTGTCSMVSESALIAGGSAKPDNWLITPKLSVKDGDKLIFWVGATSVSEKSGKERFSIRLSTTRTDIDDFTEVLVEKDSTVNNYEKREIDLSAYAGKDVFIAFIHSKVTDQSQIRMDDFILPAKYIPSKPDMIVDLKRPEYPIMPLKQAEYKFDVKAYNFGKVLETKTNAVVSVGNEFKEIMALKNPLHFDSTQYLTSKKFVPENSGIYTAEISTDNKEDEYFGDNKITYEFEVSDSVLARDKGDSYTNYMGTSDSYAGIIGHIFTLKEEDTLTSVSLFLVEPKVGDIISVDIYNFRKYPRNIKESTYELKIESSESGWHTLKFKKPVKLKARTYYLGVNEQEREILHLGVDATYYTPDVNYMFYADKWIPLDHPEFGGQYLFGLKLRANFANRGNATFIDKIEEQENLKIYPNPSVNHLFIDYTNDYRGELSITIIDVLGKTFSHEIINKSEQLLKHEINTSDLPKGCYFVRVMYDEKNIVKTIFQQ